MRHILAEFAPLKISDGSRPVLRAASAQDRRLTGVAGHRWWPAIAKMPSCSISLFDGDFTSDAGLGSATLLVRLDGLAQMDVDVLSYRWAGAPVSLYAIDPAAPLTDGCYSISSLDDVLILRGRVSRFGVESSALSLTIDVDTEPFDKDVLTLSYAGTTGIEGDPDLKDRLKPWVFGRARNVEPVLINAVDNVYQFSAYGAIQGVTALFERGASFGASFGNYANYGALVAAAIPNGRWATCHAQGLVRLGAPPYGVITGDVEGDTVSGWIRTTGAIIRRAALHAGTDAGLIDNDSLDALDAAVPYPVNLVLTEQISVIELAQRLARPCNAQAGIDWLGRLFTVRPTIGSPTLSLDAQGRRMPPVKRCTEAEVSPPYKRILFGAARSWRVHTLDEIAFTATLLNRGLYDPAETYREGNIVSLADGTLWLYVNPAPSTGNAPDAPGSVYWESMSAATIGAPPGTVVGSTPAEDIEDAVTGGLNTDGTVKVNRVATEAIQDDAVSTKVYLAAASSFAGSGSPPSTTVNHVITYSFTLDKDATVMFIGIGVQSYSGSADFGADVTVDGIVYGSIGGGAGTPIPTWTTAPVIELSAGTYSILLSWRGSAGVTLDDVTLYIQALKK